MVLDDVFVDCKDAKHSGGHLPKLSLWNIVAPELRTAANALSQHLRIKRRWMGFSEVGVMLFRGGPGGRQNGQGAGVFGRGPRGRRVRG